MALSLTRVTDYLLAQNWQIAVLVIVIAVINYALRDKSAHIRYLLWLIIIAKCLVPPFYAITLAILPPQSNTDITSIFQYVGKSPPKLEVEDTIISASSKLSSNPSEIKPVPLIGAARTEIDFKKWLGIGWLIGACAFLIFNVLRALRANLWLWRYRKPLPTGLRRKIEKSFSASGIKNFPNVWLTEGFNQPFVWGLLRGSIYLPVDFLNVNKLEHEKSVLCHEISHVLRFDAAVNILQIIAQIVFWFHPLIWWVNHKIRQEREKCCDEMAIAQLNTLPRDYSTAILETLAARHQQTRPVPTLAVAGPVKNIEERIKTMLKPGKKFYKHPSLRAIVLVLLVALFTVPTSLILSARGVTTETSAAMEKAVVGPPDTEVGREPRSPATGATATAHLGDLLRTFQDPNTNGKSWFGYSVAVLGDNVLVGAPMNRIAYLFEGSTGKLLRTFVAPEAAQARVFGWYVAAAGTNVLIADSAYGFNGDTSMGAPGRAYLFHGRTGELLHTFANPKPDSYIAFGQAVAGMGDDRVVIEATSKDRTSSVAFLFEASTGKMLQVFEKPKRAVRVTPMYACVTAAGENVLVGAADDSGLEREGSVYVFDSLTGKLVSTFLSPTPTAGDGFGNWIAVAGNNLLIASGGAFIGGKRGGAAYLFDRGTGKLLRTFLNPAPGELGEQGFGDLFGRCVAFVGNNVLIGVSLDDTGVENAGAAYLFDGTTGKVLHKFINPHPIADARFGVQVAALGNDILIGSYGVGGKSPGAVYLFKGVD